MVSTRKKSQHNRMIINQLNDFEQDVIIRDAANSGQQNNGTVKQEFAVNNSGRITNETAMHVQTLERCFIKRIDWKVGNLLTRLKIGFRTRFCPRLTI